MPLSALRAAPLRALSRLVGAARRLWAIAKAPRNFRAAKIHLLVNAFDAISADSGPDFKGEALGSYLERQLSRLHRFKNAPSLARSALGRRDQRLSCHRYQEIFDQLDKPCLVEAARQLTGPGSYLVTLLYSQLDPVIHDAQIHTRRYRVTVDIQRAPLSLEVDAWSPGSRSEAELRALIGALIEQRELAAALPLPAARSKSRTL